MILIYGLSIDLELNETKRKLEELKDDFNKKLEAEALVRNVLQESNDRLHGDLEHTRSNVDKKARSSQELEELSKRLAKVRVFFEISNRVGTGGCEGVL